MQIRKTVANDSPTRRDPITLNGLSNFTYLPNPLPMKIKSPLPHSDKPHSITL